MQKNSVDSRFLYLVLRELKQRDDAFALDTPSSSEESVYLYDHDLQELCKPTWGGTLLFDLPNSKIAIKICFSGGNASFESLDKESEFLGKVLEKYQKAIPEEHKVYLCSSVVPTQCSEEAGQRPRRQSSEPRFFAQHRKSSMPMIPTVQTSSLAVGDRGKLPSAPTLRDSFVSTEPFLDPVDIKLIQEKYPGYAKVKLFDQLLFLHALVDPNVWKYFDKVNGKKLDSEENAALGRAEKYFQEMENEAKALAELFAEQNRERSKKTQLEAKTSISPIKKGLTLRRSFSLQRLASQQKKEEGNLKVTKEMQVNFIPFLLRYAQEDPKFLLLTLRSFGKAEVKAKAAQLMNAPELFQLNKMGKEYADELMSLLVECFSLDDYNPQADSYEYGLWYCLLLEYIESYRVVPEAIISDKAIKFMLTMSGKELTGFLECLKIHNVIEGFLNLLFEKLSVQGQTRVARWLLREGSKEVATLLREKDQTRYYYSFLCLGNKAVDLALLAKPEFLSFIKDQAEPLGCYLTAQLLERMRKAFDYNNLPMDGDRGSERKQTQMGDVMDLKTKPRRDARLAFKFLSESELGNIFITLELTLDKNENVRQWKVLYLENLAIMVESFVPHLPTYLPTLASIYRRYFEQVFVTTATGGRAAWDPSLQKISAFPNEMRQYLEKNTEKKKKFEDNLEKMEPFYNRIRAIDGGTVHMHKEQQSGFISSMQIADKLLVLLSKTKLQFDQLSLSNLISRTIVDHCEKNLRKKVPCEGLCTENTIKAVKQGDDEPLWMKSHLAEALVNTFEAEIKSKASDHAFNKDFFIATIDRFCQEQADMSVDKRKKLRDSSVRRSFSFGVGFK